jgi:hypothetical protein
MMDGSISKLPCKPDASGSNGAQGPNREPWYDLGLKVDFLAFGVKGSPLLWTVDAQQMILGPRIGNKCNA